MVAIAQVIVQRHDGRILISCLLDLLVLLEEAKGLLRSHIELVKILSLKGQVIIIVALVCLRWSFNLFILRIKCIYIKKKLSSLNTYRIAILLDYYGKFYDFTLFNTLLFMFNSLEWMNKTTGTFNRFVKIILGNSYIEHRK